MRVTVCGYTWARISDALSADSEATIAKATALSRLGSDHDLPFWQAIGEFFHDEFFHDGARWRRADPGIDIVSMRRVVDLLT